MIARPDLSGASPEIIAYIEALEAEIGRSARRRAAPKPQDDEADISESNLPEETEAPTTVNVITMTRSGVLKRSPRHLYGRQRRGGMGVFDLDTPEQDPPALLTLADENQSLVLVSDQGRCYRLSLSQLAESAIRSKGIPLASLLTLRQGERIVAALPEDAGDQLVVIGQRGWVAGAPRSFVGKSMIQGVSYFEARQYGSVAAACWLAEDDELFIAARSGMAIRFPGQRIPRSGCLGIRLERDDAVVAADAIKGEEASVFLLSRDGKGSVRQMSGFRSNKSPGGEGKAALKTDALVSAVSVGPRDDLLIISRNSKLIRFPVADVPPKEGVVQGVACMALRADEAVAVTAVHL